MARRLGPGLLLAVAGIGSSHFLLAPTAGARFGTALAWTIVLGHVIKYPAFRDATLYTARTGRGVMAALAQLPGPRRWAVWAVFVLFGVEAAFVLAGVSLVAASTVLAAWPGAFVLTVLVGLLGLSGLLLWTGSYRGLERFSAWALALLSLLTLVAVVVARPGVERLAVDSVVPSMPVTSGFLVGSLLGFMPAPLELAIIKSLWNEKHEPVAGRNRVRDALLDYRLGYAVSFVLAMLLFALGAHLLHASHPDLGGFAVLAALADSYRQTLGAAAVPVVLGAAFLGMFSTVHAVADGYPRAVAAAWHALRGRAAASRDLAQWWIFYGVALLAVALVVWLPDPVAVVGLAANGTVLLAPLWAALLMWVVWRDPEARGPGHETWTSGAGVAALLAVAVVVALVVEWAP